MKPRWLIYILILSLAMNAAILATVGYRFWRGSGSHPPSTCPLDQGERYLYEDIGMSKSQLAEMALLAKTFHGKLDLFKTAMFEKKAVLVDLLSRETVDATAIENIRRDMAAIQDDIQREIVAHILQVKKIMDIKQQQRFFEIMRHNVAQVGSPLVPGGIEKQ